MKFYFAFKYTNFTEIIGNIEGWKNTKRLESLFPKGCDSPNGVFSNEAFRVA